MIAETYFQLMTNGPHWLFELTGMVLIDGLLVGLGGRYIKRRLAGLHQDIDVEHGIEHETPVATHQKMMTARSAADTRPESQHSLEDDWSNHAAHIIPREPCYLCQAELAAELSEQLDEIEQACEMCLDGEELDDCCGGSCPNARANQP